MTPEEYFEKHLTNNSWTKQKTSYECINRTV